MANEKILVVEDSEVQAEMLRRLLVMKGYRVILAKNGAQGLAMAADQRPDLVITDILMPVMDGFEMTREIKKSDETARIPVMLLTQLSDPEEIIKGLESGANNYITKPFSAEYMLEKVGEMLREPERFRNIPEEQCAQIEYNNTRHRIRAGRAVTLGFLLSSYENAVRQNAELARARDELSSLNETLEQKIRERTESLRREATERIQAEEALRASEEWFKAVVDSANDAIVCIEAPGAIYLWNKKARAMFGYQAAEVMGKNLHEVMVPEGYLQAAHEGLDNFFRTGKGDIVGKTVELTALKKDGAEFPIELSVSAMGATGQWTAIGIIRDITERKRLEQEARERLEEVERMNRFMVGRELKMEDLRQEIRELREKAKALEEEK